MLDIVYFNAVDDDFPGLLAEPIGGPLARLVRASVVSAGVEARPPTPYWDGIALHVSSGRKRFRLEFTPYFEIQSPEWSIQVVPYNVLAKLFGSNVMRCICTAVDNALHSMPAISGIRWYQLSTGVVGEGKSRF